MMKCNSHSWVSGMKDPAVTWLPLNGLVSCVMEGHHRAESSVLPIQRKPEKEGAGEGTGGWE